MDAKKPKEGAKKEMTRGKQKIEAQRRNAEKNQKAKGSQLEARAVALKVSCPICKVLPSSFFLFNYKIILLSLTSRIAFDLDDVLILFSKIDTCSSSSKTRSESHDFFKYRVTM